MEKVEMSAGLKVEDLRGITMRTHKHCQSYRVRIRMKGGQYFDRSFKSKTLAKKWKRDMESAIEHDRYEFTNPATKHTLAELIELYIERVLPSSQKMQKILLDICFGGSRAWPSLAGSDKAEPDR